MIKNGQKVGHYQIISALGAGGRGGVFLAQNTTFNRIENSEHKGKAADGQFLKRGECVKI
jgi:hypothetical protein